MWKQRLLGALAFFILRTLAFTWRWTVVVPPSMAQALKERRSILLGHWHGDELVLFHLIGKYRIATILSSSKDGEIMNTAVKLIGGVTTRGSSTRGGMSALKGLLRLIREGHYNSSFAVDGPKGPIYEVKPGIFEVSRLLKTEIYPAGVACSKAWRFPKSWNQTYLPKPFSRVVVHWGEALPAVSGEMDPRSPELAQSLKSALRHTRDMAEKNLAARNRG